MIRMIRMICICRLIRRTFQPPWTAHGKWVGLCLGLLSGMTVAKSEDAGLSIESPREWQVVQRQTATLGAIPVAVRLPDRGGAVVEARVRSHSNTTAVPSPWQRLPEEDGVHAGILPAPAGGWHRVEVRATRPDGVMSTSEVERVGVGEVFVVAGQSNSANHGEVRQRPASDRVVSLSPDGNWQPAADPQPGASGDGGSFLPPLGDRLVARFDVPIGFVACGIGATSVREWLPAGVRFPAPPTLIGHVRQVADGSWESDAVAFKVLVRRLQQCGPSGCRAVLWHQGESDANQADVSRTLPGALYEQFLGTVIRRSREESGNPAAWFVARATYHVPGDESSPDIRAAQAAVCRDGLALAGPDSDALTGPLRESGGKGVHFSNEGLRRHAEAWLDRIGPWLEGELAEALSP